MTGALVSTVAGFTGAADATGLAGSAVLATTTGAAAGVWVSTAYFFLIC